MISEGDVLAAFKVVPLSQVIPLYRWSDTSCGHPEPCAVSASTAALVMLPQYLRLSDVSLLHPDVGGAAAGLLADVAASCSTRPTRKSQRLQHRQHPTTELVAKPRSRAREREREIRIDGVAFSARAAPLSSPAGMP